MKQSSSSVQWLLIPYNVDGACGSYRPCLTCPEWNSGPSSAECVLPNITRPCFSPVTREKLLFSRSFLHLLYWLTSFRHRSSCPPSPTIVTRIMLWKPCTVLGWTTTWTLLIDCLTNMLWLPSMWTFSKTSPAHGQLVWCWLCWAVKGGILLCWAAPKWPSPWPNPIMSVSQP